MYVQFMYSAANGIVAAPSSGTAQAAARTTPSTDLAGSRAPAPTRSQAEGLCWVFARDAKGSETEITRAAGPTRELCG
jgi:hypothetical protein